MTTNTAAIVRQPAEFQYGEDFDLFFRQFTTYASNVKCDAAAQYDLLLSYLDKKSFRLVESITFTAQERAAVTGDIAAALTKLKKALTPSDKMPAKVELKFRKQGQNESLSDFGFAIQSLGTSAFGTAAVNSGQVIDAFCLGVKSAELSAKLLSAEFTTLSGAITFAHDKESAMTIRQFVVKNRAAGGRSYDNVSILQAEDTHAPEIAALANTAAPDYNATRPNRNTYQQGSRMSNRYAPQVDIQGDYPRRDQRVGDTGSGSRGAGAARNSRPDINDIQCYLCNEWGHYATNCRLRDDTKACHYCGKVGHLIRTCFKRRNDEKYGGGSQSNGRDSQPNRGGNFRQRPGNRRM